MTGRIKKANKQRELDGLVFDVLRSFQAMQWTEWYEATRVRRGEKGLGTATFSDAVKRLTAEGRVQIDGDRYYRVAYDALAGNERSDADIADIALRQLLGSL